MADTARDKFVDLIARTLAIHEDACPPDCVSAADSRLCAAGDVAAALLDGPSPPALLVEDLRALRALAEAREKTLAAHQWTYVEHAAAADWMLALIPEDTS